MALTHEEVRKISTLARLRFAPEEEAKLTHQLARIVGYIDHLQVYAGTAPEIPALGVREQEDQLHECLARERFLANAPTSMDAFLLVPEVKGGSADE